MSAAVHGATELPFCQWNVQAHGFDPIRPRRVDAATPGTKTVGTRHPNPVTPDTIYGQAMLAPMKRKGTGTSQPSAPSLPCAPPVSHSRGRDPAMLTGMYRRRFENTTFTQWDPEVDRIKAPAPAGDRAAEGRSVQPLRPARKRDSYKPLWIEVQFRGGPEASWLIRARGRNIRFPGHMCLHDCLAEVAF